MLLIQLIASISTSIANTIKEHEDLQIMLNGEQLEQVGEFVYLGSTITEDGKCGGDIRKRILV